MILWYQINQVMKVSFQIFNLKMDKNSKMEIIKSIIAIILLFSLLVLLFNGMSQEERISGRIYLRSINHWSAFRLMIQTLTEMFLNQHFWVSKHHFSHTYFNAKNLQAINYKSSMTFKWLWNRIIKWASIY